jgi:hypothetical protein
MKITIEHYNYKHEAQCDDDATRSAFIDDLQNIVSAVWDDAITIIDTDDLNALIMEAKE